MAPTYHEALGILAAVRVALLPIHGRGSLSYAVTYIDAVARNEAIGTDLGRSKERALAVQVLYILNNLTSWTGDHARSAKLQLKAYAKANS